MCSTARRNDGRYSGSLHETIASIVQRLFLISRAKKLINTISCSGDISLSLYIYAMYAVVVGWEKDKKKREPNLGNMVPGMKIQKGKRETGKQRAKQRQSG